MAEKIKVKIRGKEYSLTGDNKEAILYASEKIDNELKELSKNFVTADPETLAILAALNVAELYYYESKQKDIDENYLVNELDKMSKYLSDLQSKYQDK